MSLRILGVDPGTRSTGICLLDGGREPWTETVKVESEADWHDMAVAVWSRLPLSSLHACGIEDWQFRAPTVSRGVVKHGHVVGKIIGYLVARLEDVEVPALLVPAHEAQRDQLRGRAAKAAGVPGANQHERSAYAVACWVQTTARAKARAL